HDRVPRCAVGRGHRPLDLPRRGGGDSLHRVHVQEGLRAGAGPAGGSPHPRPQSPRPGRTDHRAHAVIEQVHADLKHSALAHLPSGVFAANAAWLVLTVMAFNLTRAAATLTGPTLARATTSTIRRKLVIVPARIVSSAR